MKIVSYKMIPDISEMILLHEKFSRFGTDTSDQINLKIQSLNNQNIIPLLEWDILMTEDEFFCVAEELKKIKNLKFIRVRDLGALEYVLENYPNLKIQLLLERGNHNLESLKAWEEYLKDRLDRFVISNELPKDKIEYYMLNLKTKIEVQVQGPILLLNTPRKIFAEDGISFISSEESPHKNFPAVQNKNGTFLFHIKNLDILDEAKSFDYIRIDNRFDFGDRETTKGFLKSNKNDVLFKKLKNLKIQRNDDSYIGEILESSKGNYLALHIQKKDMSLKVLDKIKIITPEGKNINVSITSLRNLSFQIISESSYDEIILINYVKGVGPHSVVYRNK